MSKQAERDDCDCDFCTPDRLYPHCFHCGYAGCAEMDYHTFPCLHDDCPGGEPVSDQPKAIAIELCPTRTPEPHILGEFPMTCYRCHIEADS